MTKKLTPEEMGENLEDFAEDARLLEEARGLGQRTNRDVAESLAKSPHDAARAREMGRRAAEAFAKAEAKEKEKKPKVFPLAPRRAYRWAFPAAIAASFLALFAFGRSVIVAWLSGPTVTSSLDGGPNYEPARKLREQAEDDCRLGRFGDCLRRLDEAKALYPAGDADPDIQRLRRNAEERLAREAGPAGSQK
jgi:hypothetical protein